MKQRLKWLDVARGIGLMMVIIGHAATTALRNDNELLMCVYNFVQSVHLPFLFLLSGYGYRVNEEKYLKLSNVEFIKKKSKNFLIPYVSYSVVVYLIFTVFSMLPKIGSMMEKAGYGYQNVGKFIIGLFIGDNYFAIHLWYIYVLFFFEILTFFISKIKYRNYILLVLAIILRFVSDVISGSVHLALSAGAMMYICFVIGLICPLEKVKGKTVVLSFVLWQLAYFVPVITGIEKVNNWVELTIWFVRFPLSAYALLGISKYISGIIEKSFEYLGRHSMPIYMFHQPFWGSCLGTILHRITPLPVFVIFILAIVFSVIVPTVIYYLFRRNKVLGVMFGIK